MVRLILATAIALLLPLVGMANTSMAIKYSSGSYGTCGYNSCSISLSSSGSVALNVTPSGASALCSVQSDSVTATTNSSTGYTVTVNDGDTSTVLDGGGGKTIAATTGTAASPILLSANKWGYRIDNIAGFGTGPTTSITSGSIPSLTFAAIPASNGTPDTVRTTSTADTGTVSTPVWFGICVDSSTTAGSYTDDIVYTATVN